MPNDGATLPKPADGVPRDAGGDAPTEIVAVDPVSGPSGNIAHDGRSTPICTRGPAHNFSAWRGPQHGNARQAERRAAPPAISPLQSAPRSARLSNGRRRLVYEFAPDLCPNFVPWIFGRECLRSKIFGLGVRQLWCKCCGA